ncbi:L-rhamnose mutarotase [Salinibacterium sp. TMP30]|uniref:L-rhamnose mutarotase n=1 Tax=Salinibacterium sp. TMP30 TaxID=3138237 RepID=UPI00313A4759
MSKEYSAPNVSDEEQTSSATGGVQRFCFILQLKSEMVADYLEAHATVWPEMLAAMSATGWTNYSLFIRKSDGLVVGYVETDDWERANRDLSRMVVNSHWQASMAPYFAQTDRPDQSAQLLTEYFHMD